MRPTTLALHVLRATSVVVFGAAVLLQAAEDWPDAGGAGRRGEPFDPGAERRRAELAVTSVQVWRVWKGSRADRLGIQVGDVMVGPNVQAQLADFDLRTSRALEIEDIPVDLSVRRGDETIPLRYLAEHPDAWGGQNDDVQLADAVTAQEAERARQLAELEAKEAKWRRQALNGPDPAPLSVEPDPMAGDEAGTATVATAASEPTEEAYPPTAMLEPTTTADQTDEAMSSDWGVTPFALLGLIILVIAGLLGIRRRM